MKAIITIVILALVAWGVWWFARGNDAMENADNAAAVQGAADIYNSDDVDLGEFDSKG